MISSIEFHPGGFNITLPNGEKISPYFEVIDNSLHLSGTGSNEQYLRILKLFYISNDLATYDPRFKGSTGGLTQLRDDPRPCLGGPLDLNDHNIYHDTGNARGENAFDLQYTRSTPSQVASGTNSFIASGKNNTASGESSFACNLSNTASGPFTSAFGIGSIANIWGQQALAAGWNNQPGDLQSTWTVLRGVSNDNETIELFPDGIGDYTITVDSSKVYFCMLSVIANINGARESSYIVKKFIIKTTPTSTTDSVTHITTETELNPVNQCNVDLTSDGSTLTVLCQYRNPDIYSNDFHISENWTQLSSYLNIIVSDGSTIQCANPNYDGMVLTYDTHVDITEPYLVRLHIPTVDDTHAGKYQIFARVNGTSPTTDGIIAELDLVGTTGNYSGSLKVYVGGILNATHLFTTGSEDQSYPGWFVVEIDGDIVKAWWRGNLLVNETIASQSGTNVGFAMQATIAGYCVIDQFDFLYYSVLTGSDQPYAMIHWTGLLHMVEVTPG